MNTKGGAQTTEFKFSADQYDENRHFFLGHFFRDNYDKFIAKFPYISSGVSISRIEVWVTNKRGNNDQARNILAFMDLGENEKVANDFWIGQVSKPNTQNSANNLYSTITQQYPDARNISQVTQALEGLSVHGIEGGQDYVKIENARKLESSEYTLNSQLGYISLKTMLNPDEVLAVAYEYTYNGQTFQVGEFSGNITNTEQCLFLKMLKGTTITPQLPIWKLMMKNVYSLNAYQVQKNKFRLNIKYLSDTTGVLLNYISEGNIKGIPLIRVMNLDRLDANQEANPDGIFDFVEGFTVLSANGKIFFLP